MNNLCFKQLCLIGLVSMFFVLSGAFCQVHAETFVYAVKGEWSLLYGPDLSARKSEARRSAIMSTRVFSLVENITILSDLNALEPTYETKSRTLRGVEHYAVQATLNVEFSRQPAIPEAPPRTRQELLTYFQRDLIPLGREIDRALTRIETINGKLTSGGSTSWLRHRLQQLNELDALLQHDSEHALQWLHSGPSVWLDLHDDLLSWLLEFAPLELTSGVKSSEISTEVVDQRMLPPLPQNQAGDEPSTSLIDDEAKPEEEDNGETASKLKQAMERAKQLARTFYAEASREENVEKLKKAVELFRQLREIEDDVGEDSPDSSLERIQEVDREATSGLSELRSDAASRAPAPAQQPRPPPPVQRRPRTQTSTRPVTTISSESFDDVVMLRQQPLLNWRDAQGLEYAEEFIEDEGLSGWDVARLRYHPINLADTLSVHMVKDGQEILLAELLTDEYIVDRSGQREMAYGIDYPSKYEVRCSVPSTDRSESVTILNCQGRVKGFDLISRVKLFDGTIMAGYVSLVFTTKSNSNPFMPGHGHLHLRIPRHGEPIQDRFGNTYFVRQHRPLPGDSGYQPVLSAQLQNRRKDRGMRHFTDPRVLQKEAAYRLRLSQTLAYVRSQRSAVSTESRFIIDSWIETLSNLEEEYRKDPNWFGISGQHAYDANHSLELLRSADHFLDVVRDGTRQIVEINRR